MTVLTDRKNLFGKGRTPQACAAEECRPARRKFLQALGLGGGIGMFSAQDAAATAPVPTPQIALIQSTTALLEDPAGVPSDFVSTLGHTHPGDGGGAVLQRLPSADPVAFQDQTGVFWALQPQGNRINVRQFGATGDGACDDTAAIQNALAALHHGLGDTLYFPAGRYCLRGETLSFRDGTRDITVLGDDRDTTVLVFSDTGGAPAISVSSCSEKGRVENIAFRNLTFQGSESSVHFSHPIDETKPCRSPSQAGHFQGARNLRFTDCRWTRFGAATLTLEEVSEARFQHCQFDCNITACHEVGSKHAQAQLSGLGFIDCNFVQAATLSLTGVESATVSGCTFATPNGPSLRVETCKGVEINNNRFHCGAAGSERPVHLASASAVHWNDAYIRITGNIYNASGSTTASEVVETNGLISAGTIDLLRKTAHPGYGAGTIWQGGEFSFEELDSNATEFALQTAGGVKLKAHPFNDGFLSPAQFGARKDGTFDDGPALRACLTYAHKMGYGVALGSGTYHIGTLDQPLFDYDRAADGKRNRMKITGSGPTLTTLKLNGPVKNFLFRLTGDTSKYGAPHASWIDFENFGILGNGKDQQDLFSLTCADRINFRSIQAYNCRGYAVFAREWWDSLLDARFVACGDDSEGQEKDVINFGHVFSKKVPDSACNDIFFPHTFQCEGYRWRAMYWGMGTRKCTFAGKIHQDLKRKYTQPAILLDGAIAAKFVPGFSITHDIHNSKRQRDIQVVNTGFTPVRNYFSGGTMGHGLSFVGDCRQNIVVHNVFHNGPDTACVELTGGERNIVCDNIPRGSGPEVRVAQKRNLEPKRVHSQLRVGTDPSNGWGGEPLSVNAGEKHNAARFSSDDYMSGIVLADASTTKEMRIVTKGNSLQIQKNGQPQETFD